MQLQFYKYHGTGNDFIIVDQAENQDISLHAETIRFLCDRRIGIGADGLMIYYLTENHDFGMTYFNSDGLESTMCGNGGRCMAAYWKRSGGIADYVKFKGIDGDHIAYFKDEGIIKLGMKDVPEVKKTMHGFEVDTGSPHYVLFTKHIDQLNVQEEGRKIRFSDEFAPEGINVNFVELKNDKIYIRTYERGVENETLSCGTGSVASAIAASIEKTPDKTSYDIIATGGQLKVSFTRTRDNQYKEIYLEGPATFVFKGTVQL
jgi:diaminopimelate epimerase